MDVTDVVAGDDRAVVLFRGRGSRPDGRTLDNPTSLVIRLDDGRAIEVDEFVWDLDDVEAFWS
jgi:ketosteroid isomerase-like protein